MNLSAGGVKVWDPSGDSEYDCLGYDWDRTQALPPSAEMFDFELANGLRVEMLEPFCRFRIAHAGAFDADLLWERLTDPYAFGINAGPRGLDRPRPTTTPRSLPAVRALTGEIAIDGSRIEVDTTAIRDRSWGPRSAVAARRAELMWCCASGQAPSRSIRSAPTIPSPIRSRARPTRSRSATTPGTAGGQIAGGTSRVTERGPDGRPLRMELAATDELGRELHAEGRGLNALVWSVYDRTYQLPCTTLWEFDGRRRHR